MRRPRPPEEKITEKKREQPSPLSGIKTTDLALATVQKNRLIEDINNKQHLELGVCQGCEKSLRVGARVSLYAFRAPRHEAWQTGQARCAEHSVALDALATLGVHELAVAGRVGRVLDQGLQRSWRVVLDPDVQAVSPARSSKAVRVPSTDDSRPCPRLTLDERRARTTAVSVMGVE